MDAAEIMEWVTYFYLQDDKNKTEIEEQIAEEASIQDKAKRVRAFLHTLRRKR